MTPADLDARTADLLERLTLEEKVRLLAGASGFALHGVERLGIPSLRMTDGPTGVRSITGVPATVFPVGVAIAATWNPATARTVAAAIAREALALGDQVVLAPTINIMRIPTWGRTFETYAEDPYLAGVMGAAYVQGLQGEGVGASVKHFAANNQELGRIGVDARIDERTLREIYLAAFERVVREADPWTVMASYNRLNGTFASEHRRLLTEILKREWGYAGVVVSDWTATQSTAAAANAGLDLEMPGPAKWFGERLLAAVEQGEVSRAQIDDNAGRVLRLILRSGLMDEEPRPAGALRTSEHRAVAFEAACEAMTLLKNEGRLLPLRRGLRTVALIGPNAVRFRLQGGGSSQVATEGGRSLAEGLAAALGPRTRLVVAQGVDNEPYPPTPERGMFSPDEARTAEGLAAEYFPSPDLTGEPNSRSVERHFVRWINSQLAARRRPPYGSFRWRGWFWPTQSGPYEFGLRATGGGTLRLDGTVLITPETPSRIDRQDVTGTPAARRLATAVLEAGRGYEIELDYVPSDPERDYVGLGVRAPSEPMDEAVEAARAADAVVLVLGSASATEAEGYDREDLDLPGPQDELARAVLAANPRTVVVMNTGAPFAMPWIDQAPAVLQMWLPGEAGPDALAAVLLGDRDPGGRLPMSFPRAFGDHPAHGTSSDPEVCAYVEGLGVGYRGYDASDAKPLFPFGHGLAYTEFAYLEMTAPETARIGEPIGVEVAVANVGDRAGQEVVQLYVAPLAPRLPRPPKELKAFVKIAFAPGETKRVALGLESAAFAFWDPAAGGWAVDPGVYELRVGRSAGDLRLRARIELR